MKRALLTISTLMAITGISAQNIPGEATISISAAIDPVSLDGVLDEASWQAADVATDFYQNFPVDDQPATSTVEVRTTFDQKFLYFGIICYDPTGGPYIVESLKRDFNWPATENISIYIDPFDDKTNGFTFALSPYNVQREGLISSGVDISDNWDNKWYSEVIISEHQWVAEIAIPFKTLRYKENLTNWNIQFIRNDLKTGQKTVWTNVKQQFRTNTMTFAGKLVWNDPPPPSGTNISVIPYVLGSTATDFEENTPNEFGGNVGFDAKIGVTSSLNLDLTVNPDFSQVEVDQQIVNLDRFELFFPEKRQFFLENSDLFTESGFPITRPFFSRRIGIAQDTSGRSMQIPILFGARLSGKLNKDWRMGLMNMQTKATPGSVLPGTENINGGYNLTGQNYTTAVIQRKLWARSNIGLLFVNRQATNYDASDTTNSTSAFNRVAGIDFNFADITNTWRARVYLHTSIDPVKKKNSFVQGTFVGYQSRHWSINTFINYIGDGYNAEVGFVPRKGTFSTGIFRSNYIIYPEAQAIVTIKPGAEFTYTQLTDGRTADWITGPTLEVNFLNTSSFRARLINNFTRLFFDFDPTRTGGIPLPAGTSYTWLDGLVSYQSDKRRAYSYTLSAQYGSFYNGLKLTTITEFGYKFRPFGSIFISAIYNDVALPEPHNSTRFWLIGPRLDVTFTNKVFLTTFVQYNEQADNVNINARLQWRFAPVSDLFVVYTDNYFPTNLMPKNRALVVKLSYWLNL